MGSRSPGADGLPGHPANIANPASIEACVRDHVEFKHDGVGWRGMPELPRPGEVTQRWEDVEELPKNPVNECWSSKEAYLEAQYRILRRESIEGLRFAINSYRNNPEMLDDRDTCVYVRVFVKGYLFTTQGAFCRVTFSTRRANMNIKWQQSRRLTSGSLIGITTAEDNFKTICKVGTVAQRPYRGGLDQTPPEIDILFAEDEQSITNPAVELVMVESRTGFFESTRHALTGLQHMAQTPSRFDKYFVDCHADIPPASFVQESPTMNLSQLANQAPAGAEDPAAELNRAKDALSAQDVLHPISASAAITSVTTMDSSQLEALQRMISLELGIVQGPPGTGKTYTSVSALSILLRHAQSRGGPPIVVASQTNHALDQMLSSCHAAGWDVLRLGGGSDDEVIKEYTLFNLKKQYQGRSFAGMSRQRLREVQVLSDETAKRFDHAIREVFPDNDDILHPQTLLDCGIISQEQLDNLVGGDWKNGSEDPDPLKTAMEEWLGDMREPYSSAILNDPEFEDVETEVEGRRYEVDITLDRAADEDEEYRVGGKWVSVRHAMTGKLPNKGRKVTPEQQLQTADLWKIPSRYRGLVYRFFQSALVAQKTPLLIDRLRRYSQHCRDRKIRRWTEEVKFVQQQGIQIIGCTTTGLTKFRGFLAALQPQTLLVEEAAETREANIVSAVFPSLQQLILVGDHQQLKPRCDVQALGVAPYNLNVSLFERLVDMRVPFTQLIRQRRMKPEIRELLTYFYPSIADHPLVQDPAQRPDVPGMGGRNTWFFHHTWPEEADTDMSKFNSPEAEMVAKFFVYLVANGMNPAKITILSFYNGQRKVLLKKLRLEPMLQGVPSLNVFTVDSYQGEENDVVLLSLVRSPKPDGPARVGFLEDRHRATVAISRARCGFYIFGNLPNLLTANDASYHLWGNVQHYFATKSRICLEKGLPIVCQNHKTEHWIRDPAQFDGNAGGCWLKCGGKLPCGHLCKLNCHPKPHEDYPCSMQCDKPLPCRHPCSNKCSEKCHCEWCHPKKPKQADGRGSFLGAHGRGAQAHGGFRRQKMEILQPTRVNAGGPQNWSNFQQVIEESDECLRQERLQQAQPSSAVEKVNGALAGGPLIDLSGAQTTPPETPPINCSDTQSSSALTALSDFCETPAASPPVNIGEGRQPAWNERFKQVDIVDGRRTSRRPNGGSNSMTTSPARGQTAPPPRGAAQSPSQPASQLAGGAGLGISSTSAPRQATGLPPNAPTIRNGERGRRNSRRNGQRIAQGNGWDNGQSNGQQRGQKDNLKNGRNYGRNDDKIESQNNAGGDEGEESYSWLNGDAAGGWD